MLPPHQYYYNEPTRWQSRESRSAASGASTQMVATTTSTQIVATTTSTQMVATTTSTQMVATTTRTQMVATTTSTQMMATGDSTRTVATATGASNSTAAMDTSDRQVMTGTCTRSVVLGDEGRRESGVDKYLRGRTKLGKKVMSTSEGSRRSMSYLMLEKDGSKTKYYTTVQYTGVGPKFEEFPEEMFKTVLSTVPVVKHTWGGKRPRLSRNRFTKDGFHPNLETSHSAS